MAEMRPFDLRTDSRLFVTFVHAATVRCRFSFDKNYARAEMAQGQVFSSVGGVADASDDTQKTTTRADLAEAVHLKTGLGRTDAAKYVEMVLDEIFECIVSREEVKLSSFGAFVIRRKKERLGRNPKTGEGAKITARLVVSFKPSNILRARINGDAASNGQALGDEFDEATGGAKSKGTGKSR